MNLRYGHWCQRLGLTIVSGIVATFLAPAALAAPIDEQGAQSDSSIADSQVSTSEEEAQSGSAAVDQASARDADSADAATASSEERAEEGGSAHVLTFPGASGPTRIHFLSTQGAADAILLESRGVFAMIDGGEGLGAPDGSDPRYPWRDGIEDPSKGDTEWVLGYMRRHGVTSSNLAFYLGTHAHSDHIDNADDIIYEFHPQVILTPEYSDEWITDKSRLWDNQWCYDNMMTAARWAASAYGATVMQHVNDDDTHIQLGDMDVQLIPVDPDENYKKVGVRDANLIAYTAKVSAFGSSAYLAADLEARGGYEDRIAPHCRARRPAESRAPWNGELELPCVHGGAQSLDDRPDGPEVVCSRQSHGQRYSWGCVVGANPGSMVGGFHPRCRRYLHHLLGHFL